MKKLPLVILTALFCLIAGTGWGADLQKGLDAYESEDYAAALRELKPLAEQGNAIALFNLGMMHLHGLGVLQDYAEAVKWLRLAAEQGYAEAQINLGVMHQQGVAGDFQDHKTAAKWFRLAAEQGVAEAQYNLGLSYGRGEGVLKDYVYAYMWFNMAASNGNESAVEGRDIMTNLMTSAERAEAQRLARECMQNDYKGC